MSEPLRAIRYLLVELVNVYGVSASDLYWACLASGQCCLKDGDEPGHDLMLDACDLLSGWCSPNVRIVRRDDETSQSQTAPVLPSQQCSRINPHEPHYIPGFGTTGISCSGLPEKESQ